MIRESENQETIQQQSTFELKKALMEIFLFALQVSIGLISINVLMAISIHYISSNSTLIDVNAFGFCFILFFMLIVPCCLGFNQSLNVHVAQASTNQGLGLSYLMLNLYFQSIFIILMTLIIYLLKYPLSLIIKEDREETINQSWTLFPYMAVFVIAMVNFNNIRSYLFGRKCIYIFKYIHFANILLHIIFCEILVPNSQNKIIGVGRALVFTQVSTLMILIISILLTEIKTKFIGIQQFLAFNYQLFKSYLHSTAAIVLQLYLDFFLLHILNLLASRLSSVQFNAQIIYINFIILYLKLPFSIALTIQIYVGSEISKGNVRDAKNYSLIGAILIIMLVFIMSPLCWIFSDQIILLYTQDEEVQLLCKSLFNLIIFLCLPFDCVTLIQVGILRGLDASNNISLITSILYYPFGLPLVYILTFVIRMDPQLKGIWLGYLLIDIFLFTFLMITQYLINWEKKSTQIQQKIHKQKNLCDVEEENQELKD